MKGDVVVVPFPFADLTNAKRRPALVLAELKRNDLILCQITSQTVLDEYSIGLSEDDFTQGGLRVRSNIRPNRVFTADSRIVLYKAGAVSRAKLAEAIDRVVSILRP